MSETTPEVISTEITADIDPREPLRDAHRERDSARGERDQLAEVLEDHRAELQRLLDVQRGHEAIYDAEIARVVKGRTTALLRGDADIAELPRPAPDAGLTREIEAARMVEAQLVTKLNDAETAMRYAESRVLDSAVGLLVAHGEEMAHALELGEAECRAQRASLSALAGLWTRNGGRTRPIQIGQKATWVLTNDYREPEGIIGLRAQLASQRRHILPEERGAPNWSMVLNQLLIDPETELP